MTALQDHRGRPRVAVTGHRREDPGRQRRRHVLADARSRVARPRRPINVIDPSRAARAVRLRGARLRPDRVPRRRRRRAGVDRVTQLGFAAAADALADAGDLGRRSGALRGRHRHRHRRAHHARGPGRRCTCRRAPARVSPFFVPMMMTNATAGTVAMQFGWTGPNLCISTACAASAHAIGEAARLIRDGSADVVHRRAAPRRA